MATSEGTDNPYSAWSTEKLIAKLKRYKESVAYYQSRIEYYNKVSTRTRYGNSRCEKEIRTCNNYISYYNAHIIKVQQVLSARAVDLKNIMNALMLGKTGVGKTHLAALLLKKLVPLKGVSTPCAEALPWRLSSSQVRKSLTGIIILTDEIYTVLMIKLQVKVESGFMEEVDADIPVASAHMALNSERHSLENTTSTINDVDLHFLAAKTHMQKLKHTGSQIFGRIVDTGGQPQLLELLPQFISYITHSAVVVDLSQSLDKYPISYFYGAKGKSIGKEICSNLTNEQVVHIFFQMITSLSTDKKKVKIIIVGTHRDVERQCFESRENKEGKLKAIVSSTNPDQKATSEGIWIQFKEQGIVNEKILEKISNSFDDLFTPKNMLEGMEKLSIICKLKEGKYIMPSLLTALGTLPHSQSSRLRWLPFNLGNYFWRLMSGLKSDITMLAYFPVGVSRFGVYCGTVRKLISEYQWKITREVSRNRFQFAQPNSPGVVSFIDSFDSFFVVNLDIPSEFSSEVISLVCHNVCQTIFGAIKKVSADLGYTPSDPMVAFLCDHNSSIPHVAEYLSQYDCLRCIRDNDHLIQLTHKHRLWLKRSTAGSSNDNKCSTGQTNLCQDDRTTTSDQNVTTPKSRLHQIDYNSDKLQEELEDCHIYR